MKKLWFAIIWIMLIPYNAYTQLFQSKISTYDFSKLEINPAYAGSRNGLSVSDVFSNHLDLNNNIYLIENVLSIHTPLLKNKLGIGFATTYNKSEFFNFSLSLAYRLRLGEKKNHILSFGLRGDVLHYEQRAHLGFGNGIGNISKPQKITDITGNFGLGLYYQNDFMFAGFSVPKILDTYFYIANPFESIRIVNRKYNFLLGAIIYIDKKHIFQMLPTTLFSLHEKQYGFIKLNNKFILLNKFWIGVGYEKYFYLRNKNDVNPNTLNVSIGGNLFNRIELAYNLSNHFYEKGIFSSSPFYLSSHEIILRVDIQYYNKDVKMRTRYF